MRKSIIVFSLFALAISANAQLSASTQDTSTLLVWTRQSFVGKEALSILPEQKQEAARPDDGLDTITLRSIDNIVTGAEWGLRYVYRSKDLAKSAPQKCTFEGRKAERYVIYDDKILLLNVKQYRDGTIVGESPFEVIELQDVK